LKICDSDEKQIIKTNTCGCFVVPYGKEFYYLYATESGNKELLKMYYFI